MLRKALRNTMARSRNAPAKKLREKSQEKSQGSRKPSARSVGRQSRQTSAENSAPQLPPPPGEGKRGEQGYLAYLLRQAQAATRLAMERSLADLGVTSPQFVVLTMLKAYPGLSGADLARVAMLTPQTVGVIIRNLERDDAIKKTPHPVHGRVLQWTVTRRGAALLDRCKRHAQVIEQRLTAGLSARDQTMIRRWLARIAADL
jgi:DNA-binding MarR family transcriptional regulator